VKIMRFDYYADLGLKGSMELTGNARVTLGAPSHDDSTGERYEHSPSDVRASSHGMCLYVCVFRYLPFQLDTGSGRVFYLRTNTPAKAELWQRMIRVWVDEYCAQTRMIGSSKAVLTGAKVAVAMRAGALEGQESHDRVEG
jgi:hypothetical protein